MSFVGKFKQGDTYSPIAATLYGTCATAASTAEKAVTLADCDKLIPGMSVTVKFTNSNTAASPTLNINSLGAVAIYRYGITAAGNKAITSWPAGAVMQFTYGIVAAGGEGEEDTYGFYMTGADAVSDLISAIYPVGAIYMSVNSTDPGTLFGGTWERIKDKFLLSAGDTYAAAETGGYANAIVPYHRHTLYSMSTNSSTLNNSHNLGKTGSYVKRAITFLLDGNTTSLSTKKVQEADDGVLVPSINAGSFDSTYETSTQDLSHSHSIPTYNTTYAGTSGNTTGANMPPYLAVYVWKRVS